MSMRLISILFGFLCIFALPAGAQQQKLWSHPDEPGQWITWETSCDMGKGPLFSDWEKQLKEIAAMVRGCAVFQDMRGYYPMLTGCVDNPAGSGPSGGSVALLIWPPETVERGTKGEPRVMTKWRYNHPGDTGGSLWIMVNSIGDLRDMYAGEDKEGKFYELPEPSRHVAGFPVIGGFLLVTPPGKPPLFSPVTRERAQRWIIDNLKRQAAADDSILESARRHYEEFVSPAGQARRLKEIEAAAASQKKPENQESVRRQEEAKDRRREQDLKAATVLKPGGPEARTKERLAELEARLASLTPEQRRQPAWYQRHPEGVRRLDYGNIVEPDTPGARPLVVPNPNYLDRSLPKTAMQLVSVPAAGHYAAQVGKGLKDIGTIVPAAVIEQLDWKALAARMK